MVTRIGTKQRKTRKKFTVNHRNKGKIPLSKYFQVFENGDKVNLKIMATVMKGRFFPRFVGKTGTIVGKKGRCYDVQIMDGNKKKNLYIHAFHLTKQK
jgi:large subunit ribosomal protein L21e